MADGFNYTPQMVGGGDSGFGGGGLIGGVVLGALLGNRGGLFGNNDGRRDDGAGCVTPAMLFASQNGTMDAINNGINLSKLGNIEGLIPNSALQQTNAIQSSIGSLALGTQQAFSNVKDAVQNSALTSQASFAATQAVINADGDRTRALITANEMATLNRELGVAQSALLEERFSRRSRESEFSIVNTNTAVATQAQNQTQTQSQFQFLAGLVGNLANDLQAIRQGQVIFNSGTMAASGTQAAANTRVA